MGRKILALVSEPVSGDALRSALGEGADQAEVMVVAPAFDKKTRFWTSDSDEAIARAESTAAQTAEALAREGARTKAVPGESEPLLALQDALARYPADRVLVFARADESARYREDDVCGEAERRFGVPVTEVAL